MNQAFIVRSHTGERVILAPGGHLIVETYDGKAKIVNVHMHFSLQDRFEDIANAMNAMEISEDPVKNRGGQMGAWKNKCSVCDKQCKYTMCDSCVKNV